MFTSCCQYCCSFYCNILLLLLMYIGSLSPITVYASHLLEYFGWYCCINASYQSPLECNISCFIQAQSEYKYTTVFNDVSLLICEVDSHRGGAPELASNIRYKYFSMDLFRLWSQIEPDETSATSSWVKRAWEANVCILSSSTFFLFEVLNIASHDKESSLTGCDTVRGLFSDYLKNTCMLFLGCYILNLYYSKEIHLYLSLTF